MMNAQTLDPVPLEPTAAAAYIRSCLEEGLTLSTLLLETLTLAAGESYALLPPGLSHASVLDFTHGGKLAPLRAAPGSGPSRVTAIPSADRELAEVVRGWLSESGSGAVCLLENAVARAGEPFLARHSSRIVTHGGEVYHALAAGDAVPERIARAIREAKSIPTFIGVRSSLSRDRLRPLEERRAESLSSDDLAEVARNTLSLFVGAYDGESYVIWSAS